MKRFVWPLQRLLDVTVHRERAHKAELLALASRVAGLRQQIAQRRFILNVSLQELSKQKLPDRVSDQETFINNSAHDRRRIRQLESQLRQAESKRETLIKELLAIKSKREALEARREADRAAHLKQEMKREQKRLDESAHISYARRQADRPSTHLRSGTAI